MIIKGKAIQIKGRTIRALSILLFSIFCISQNVIVSAAETAVEPNEPKIERVPITLAVPDAIAGAEFEIKYTPGLKLLSFVKSETINAAFTTPVVEKNGKTHFGFFYSSNDFVPNNGVLDVGYLEFEYTGEPNQFVQLTEVKYVQVVDKDTTNSNILNLNQIIDVPLKKGSGLHIGDEDKKQTPWWIYAGGALILAAIGAISGTIIYKKKKNSEVAAASEELSDEESYEESNNYNESLEGSSEEETDNNE